MRRFGLVRLTATLFIVSALAASSTCPHAQADGVAVFPAAYETEFEVGEGLNANLYRVLFDSGRYRREYNPGGQPGLVLPLDAAKDITEIYDGTPQHGIWIIWPTGQACPDNCTIDYAYYLAAQRDGDAAVRRHYHIEGTLPFRSKLTLPDTSRIPTYAKLEAFGSLDVHKSGTDTVAGYVCERYEGRVVKTAQGRGANANKVMSLTSDIQVWVEPKTQLVLKSNIRYQSSDPRTPPSRRTFEVHKLTFLKSVPLSRFQLPPGTQATMPEILRDIPLPRGVVRYVTDPVTQRPQLVRDAK